MVQMGLLDDGISQSITHMHPEMMAHFGSIRIQFDMELQSQAPPLLLADIASL